MSILEDDLKRMEQTYEMLIDRVEKSLRTINIDIREEDGKYKPFLEVINGVQKAFKKLSNKKEDEILKEFVLQSIVGIIDVNKLIEILSEVEGVHMDYLEKEYGIKENERYYSVIFELDGRCHDTMQVKGEVLNFHPAQLVLKSNKGLYIIKPRNIIEMLPIKSKNKIN